MEFRSIPKETRDVIIGRRMICLTCPYMSKNAVKGYEIDGKWDVYMTNRSDEHCIWCGCPVSTRTASLDSGCGIEIYNVENGKDVSLKWNKL